MGSGKGHNKRIKNTLLINKSWKDFNIENTIDYFANINDILPDGFGLELDIDKTQFSISYDEACYIIRHKNKKVGRLEFYFSFIKGNKPEIEISRLILTNENEDVRGRGIGKKITQEIIKKSNEINLEKINLTAVEDGRWWWKQFGFMPKSIDEYKRDKLISECETLLDIYAREYKLRSYDEYRWNRFKNKIKNEKNLPSVFDFHDFTIDDKISFIDMLQDEKIIRNLTDSAAECMLGWKGELILTQE